MAHLFIIVGAIFFMKCVNETLDSGLFILGWLIHETGMSYCSPQKIEQY